MTQPNPDPSPARSLMILETEVRLLAKKLYVAGKIGATKSLLLEQAEQDAESLESQLLTLLREAAQAQEPGGVEELEWREFGTEWNKLWTARKDFPAKTNKTVCTLRVALEVAQVDEGYRGGIYLSFVKGELASAAEIHGSDPEALKADLLTRLHHLRRALG